MGVYEHRIRVEKADTLEIDENGQRSLSLQGDRRMARYQIVRAMWTVGLLLQNAGKIRCVCVACHASAQGQND